MQAVPFQFALGIMSSNLKSCFSPGKKCCPEYDINCTDQIKRSASGYNREKEATTKKNSSLYEMTHLYTSKVKLETSPNINVVSAAEEKSPYHRDQT